MNRMAFDNLVESIEHMDPRRSHEAPASRRLREEARRQALATWSIAVAVLGSTATALVWLLAVAP